jgi:hypothetical protein
VLLAHAIAFVESYIRAVHADYVFVKEMQFSSGFLFITPNNAEKVFRWHC